MSTEKVANTDTFCNYCGGDIQKGEKYFEIAALLPKTCCNACEDAANTRREESEREPLYDSNN